MLSQSCMNGRVVLGQVAGKRDRLGTVVGFFRVVFARIGLQQHFGLYCCTDRIMYAFNVAS